MVEAAISGLQSAVAQLRQDALETATATNGQIETLRKDVQDSAVSMKEQIDLINQTIPAQNDAIVQRSKDLHELISELNTRVVPTESTTAQEKDINNEIQTKSASVDKPIANFTGAIDRMSQSLAPYRGYVATQASITPSIGESKTSTSLDCDKRMNDVEKLSGTESLAETKDWYKRVEIDISSARPGPSKFLDWALGVEGAIQSERIGSPFQGPDLQLAHRLNGELVAFVAS